MSIFDFNLVHSVAVTRIRCLACYDFHVQVVFQIVCGSVMHVEFNYIFFFFCTYFAATPITKSRKDRKKALSRRN